MLPTGVLLRCLTEAFVWSVDFVLPEAIRAKEARTGWKACTSCGGQGFQVVAGCRTTLGPWFVSRAWRDAFWSGPDLEGWLWEVRIC